MKKEMSKAKDKWGCFMQIGTLQQCATTEIRVTMITWHDDLWPGASGLPSVGYLSPHPDGASALEAVVFANLQPNIYHTLI